MCPLLLSFSVWKCCIVNACLFCGFFFNSHWCTVQWGVVMYHEERDGMQMYYKCVLFSNDRGVDNILIHQNTKGKL